MRVEALLKRLGNVVRRVGREEKGMSLIEIMVVITIMGLVMSMIGVSVLGFLSDAKVDTTKTQMKVIQNGLLAYKIKNGRYPTSSEGLQALINPPSTAKSKTPIIEAKAVPKDGWGSDFVYYSPGTHGDNAFEIVSYGEDGAPGGEGVDADINSWELE